MTALCLHVIPEAVVRVGLFSCKFIILKIRWSIYYFCITSLIFGYLQPSSNSYHKIALYVMSSLNICPLFKKYKSCRFNHARALSFIQKNSRALSCLQIINISNSSDLCLRNSLKMADN